MAYAQGFTYVSGPLYLREFNLTSTTTVSAFQPVKLNGAGTIVESLGTDSVLAGFINHRAIDSVPAGKCLVSVPADSRTIFAGIGDTSVTASTASSGATLGQRKSGNSWFLQASSSTVSAMYVVVPREDGSTFDSTDSSVWISVIGAALRPFGQSVVAPVI